MQFDTPTAAGGRLPLAAPPAPAAKGTTPTSANAARIDALDITKGMLVVFMVVYHSLNYSSDYRVPFRYLYFLPPSFILISGFLLSHIYLARRGVVDAPLCRRLFSRGLKLLVLFTLLNVAGQFVRSQSYHGPARGIGAFLDAMPEIFIFGGSRLATFDILLPIAYLLLLAPALLWLNSHGKFVLPMLTFAVVGTCIWLDRQSECPTNLAFMAVGLFGMLSGCLPKTTVTRIGKLLPLAIPVYAVLFYVGQNFGQTFLQQLLAAVCALVILLGVAAVVDSSNWFVRRLIILGRFSLIAYILQIAILQLYSHLMGRPDPLSLELMTMFGATLVLTAVAAETIAWASRRSQLFRTAYSTVIP